MSPLVVRVTLVVDLESEEVLEEVARFLGLQTSHDRRPLGDVYDLKPAGFRQHAGELLDLLRSRDTVGVGAQLELAQRTDVAEFPDAVVTVVVRQPMGVGHRAGGLAEQGRPADEASEDALLHRLRHDLAPGGVVVGFGQAVGLVVRRDLVAVEEPGEHRGVGVLAKLTGSLKVSVGVVQAGHERAPVQDRPVGPWQHRAHELQGLGGDAGRVRLDLRVVDTGVGEEKRHLERAQLVEPVGVLGLEAVPRDHENVVGQPAGVQVFQHGEGVRSDRRQERLGRPVEQLHGRDVRREVAVPHQLLDRLGVGHERSRYPLIPQAVGVADAVCAVQRAALDVVEAEAALAVLDHLPCT